MAAYYVGDVPAEDLVIEPALNGEAMDLAPFDDVDVVLTDPDGVVVPTPTMFAEIDGLNVVVEWPATSVLEVPGMHALTLVLLGPAGVRVQLAPVYLVVQGDDGWHTLDSIRSEWEDAPNEDRQLHELLWVARTAIEAYAPAFVGRPPTDYRKAQALQARNVWNSAMVSPDGGFGDGTGFAARPFPLDWQIKQLVRPKRGIPVVA